MLALGPEEVKRKNELFDSKSSILEYTAPNPSSRVTILSRTMKRKVKSTEKEEKNKTTEQALEWGPRLSLLLENGFS